MLKWLVTGDLGPDIHEKITEDPLATIKLGKKKKSDKVYSVNRYKYSYVNLSVVNSVHKKPL